MSPARLGSLLLVSYFYPPTRDTGAQRPAAMAKWLARLGWDVSVVTTGAFGAGDGEGPGAAASGERIRVIRSFDMQTWRARMAGHDHVDSLFDSDSYTGRPHPLSKVIVPEPLAVAWAPFARRAALAAHRERPFDAVLTTSPPESAHTVGAALQRKGARWVADIRDAWTFEPLRPPFPTGLQHRLDERLERRRLGAADAVVCVSEPAATDLRSRGIADPVVIANAWDPDSDPGPEAEAAVEGLLDPERLSLLYTGRFGSYGRDPRPFAEALGRLASTAPEEAKRLEVAVAGPLTPDERALFEGFEGAGGSSVKVSLLGSMERELSLALQRRADALLLLAQPTRSQLVNFKLFEYLAAGTPILALAAGTEAGRIAADAGVSPIVRADDPEAIAAALSALVRGELEGPDPGASDRYAYPAAAEAMSSVLLGG
ncbi:MAG: glycosyltransferase [Solirubrobacterales bacterium]